MEAEISENTRWELRRGAELLAIITVTGDDFPWYLGEIFQEDSFQELQHFFRAQSDLKSLEKTREELYRLKVNLFAPNGEPVRAFTLVVEGEKARFRFLANAIPNNKGSP